MQVKCSVCKLGVRREKVQKHEAEHRDKGLATVLCPVVIRLNAIIACPYTVCVMLYRPE